ncbi:DNA polymerase subunit gamma-1-like [Mizuhopecten yessoensis]|uniref:DNA polymerase subunit gamma-1 n=1 Tax=Mizuhopecten yessoensis TaxID=6573 RepID=A0A210Q366_MIZYE|nr:DNA polymerase subunit gamma-1-like [Mizuhopecten yessoensis]OWF43177.1 DNA polymerase subunit gamma-1 [Mizuhopecten yessoensis]
MAQVHHTLCNYTHRLLGRHWRSKVKRHNCRRPIHVGNACLCDHQKENARKNEIGIQMLSPNLREQLFGKEIEQKSVTDKNEGSDGKAEMAAIRKHLSAHGLWGRESTILPDVDIKIPELKGKNVAEHMQNLAQQQVGGYQTLASLMANPEFKFPPKPKTWAMSPGWTKYDSETKKTVKVDFPEENILVFDVEVLVPEGNYPTMATAVSPKHWYSWCSELVLKDRYRWTKVPFLSDLIPLESGPVVNGQSPKDWPQRLIIGHNVGFDRSFVKEQYYVQKSKLRFLDTMSMHIAICGQTTYQRILYQATNKASNRKEVREHTARTKHMQVDDEWKMVSTLNNLNDVHKLHVGGGNLNKETRNVFVKGTMKDVRTNFQELMEYCASDVVATTKVFQQLYPEYRKRFPHPVTMAGMLEMGTAYLPVNKNWGRYIDESNNIYNDLQRELKLSLMKLADEACQLLHSKEYKNDPWLWDLDWQVANIKMNKEKKTGKKNPNQEDRDENDTDKIIARTYATKSRVPKRPVHTPGYPNWYRALCPKNSDPDWSVGPSLISTQVRITPKLMRLTWDGYPLHYSEKYGWGYLVPDPEKAARDMQELDNPEKQEKGKPRFPIESVLKLCGMAVPGDLENPDSLRNFEDTMNSVMKDAAVDLDLHERMRHLDKAKIKRERRLSVLHDREKGQALEPMDDENIPGCHFVPLPHKNGKGYRVGNPVVRDYISKIEAGTLKALLGTSAQRILTLGSMSSYWKNNMKRIESQMALGLTSQDLPDTITSNQDYDEKDYLGAIVPRIVPAGTITRRAVEQTWLTASNAYPDRVGSELKAMIQTPPGYKFVGADVDSEELWIAALIGDAHAKIHGCTAFGWMTLQGKKSDKTDLHSKTADTVGISRDHAKIFNYGRIYGAGRLFAQRLLMQFNHRLTAAEATKKANIMYSSTKGSRKKKLQESADGTLFYKTVWAGGSESEMFNQLEAIATRESPTTPVLDCHISKALEPQYVGDDFMTSRVNWVVQSSAVDYLHLMLVCMGWLIKEYDIDARFSISIHDEVRYLVADKDKYRAGLALQITNLLTRSMFAYKLGMKDLPRSVAFFSAVDIDTCMRKEVTLDCRTPSNPRGMEMGYGVMNGEALDILEILEKTDGGQLRVNPEIERLSDEATDDETADNDTIYG